ncbi:group III truncated hemoglobin [Montanilutibacter psychrotolerans]|uniref:Group III truncated hemoglobin n=1 Tax=Montanilutibacter psychrotolerans TaxID=1327343 RepID=A0A3M8T2G8_9GAMM|nr:group III truncated hemoglobin [Lysobacter psychrotolerans]RNF85926.1 group III truncated hemoglobin [Lysobacter psychrotolerans]
MTTDFLSLDESGLAQLVDAFYEKVRADAMLGPVFNQAVDDWPEHKRLLTSFWASITLEARSYRGNPMAKHRGLPIRAEHFDQWLALWRETTDALFAPEHAQLLQGHAERIGRSLRYGVGIEPETRGLGLPVIGGAS